MIPLREVIAWRAHAPWADDQMVEQDYLISRAVEHIISHPKLGRQLAMRGGTVLHKGHRSPAARYSEDIDLVLVEPRRSHRGIREDLTAVLRPLLRRPTESVVTTVTLFVRNLAAKSKIARLTYVYDPTDTSRALANLKVEVNLNETKPFYPLTTVPLLVPDTAGRVREVQVVSYDLDEMLATKLRALFQREHGRDLFDLWHAWRMSSSGQARHVVDPERVGRAFRHYLQQEGSESFSAVDAATELDRRMHSKKFLSDMNGHLPADHTYDPFEAAAEFRRVFLPHL